MAIPILLPFTLGIFSGSILGLTGAGGAIIAVPVLVFGMGLTMVEAAPIALLATAIGALTGAAIGLRDRTLRYKAATVMAVTGLLLSPLGLWTASRIPNQPLQIIFALVLCYVALIIYTGTRKSNARINPNQYELGPPCMLDNTRGKLIWSLPCFRAMISAGALTGFLSGLLGVGGGFIIIPALRKVTNLSIQSIMTTSLGVIAVVSIGSVTTATIGGMMTWPIGLPFAAGAFVGMLVGRRWNQMLDSVLLQKIFSGLAFSVGIALLIKALI